MSATQSRFFVPSAGMALWLLTMAGCTAGSHATDAGTDAADGSDGGSGYDVVPICLHPPAGSRPLIFTDVTDQLGLGKAGLNITATQATVSDVDGDHWPDILLSQGANLREDPAAPKGYYRLLRNGKGAAFEDWTWSSGLFETRDGTQGRATEFVLFADVDNDGDEDAFNAVFMNYDNAQTLKDRSTIFLNNGDGTFTIGPDQSFTPGTYDPIAGATFLDFDRDGNLDLFTGHWYGRYGYLDTTMQDSLWVGKGDGRFLDVTTWAKLTTQPFSAASAAAGKSHRPTWGVTACDIDGDGWDDLMTCSYGRMYNAFYHNLGGTFEDLTMSSGFSADDDINYHDDNYYRCYCRSHPTEPTCAGAGAPQIDCTGLENAWQPGLTDQPWMLGGNYANAVCGDVNNDGRMDLLVTTIAHWHIGESSDKTELLINDGFPQKPLRRPGNASTGLTRVHETVDWNEGDLGAALVDFDNDGRLDVLVASSDYPHTYSLLWQQQGDGKFLEVGQDAGARINRSHGIGVIDFDRDGDYDLVIGTSLMRWTASDDPPAPDAPYARLLRNDTGQDANKLMFHLVGAAGQEGANKDAIGARIEVTAGGRIFVREIQGGYGLGGFQQDRLMIIGIGELCQADQITIRWPSRSEKHITFKKVPANYVLWIEEDQPIRFMTLEEYAPR